MESINRLGNPSGDVAKKFAKLPTLPNFQAVGGGSVTPEIVFFSRGICSVSQFRDGQGDFTKKYSGIFEELLDFALKTC